MTHGDAMSATTDLAALERTADFYSGISASACCIDHGLYDFRVPTAVNRLTEEPVLKASIYQRGSVSTLAFRNRSGSQSTLLRLASHSNLSLRGPQGEEDDVTTHPVEPRATTAMLPPVMVRRIKVFGA